TSCGRLHRTGRDNPTTSRQGSFPRVRLAFFARCSWHSPFVGLLVVAFGEVMLISLAVEFPEALGVVVAPVPGVGQQVDQVLGRVALSAPEHAGDSVAALPDRGFVGHGCLLSCDAMARRRCGSY